MHNFSQHPNCDGIVSEHKLTPNSNGQDEQTIWLLQ